MLYDSLWVFLSLVLCLMSSVSDACTERLPSPSKTLKVIVTYCPLSGRDNNGNASITFNVPHFVFLVLID